jgi:hypothetical protein
MAEMTKNLYVRFLFRLLVFSLALGVVTVTLYFLTPGKYFTPVLPLIFLFFMIVTYAGYYILVRAARQKFMRFLNIFMLTTVIKLVIFIGVIFIYLLMNKKDAIPFALWFFLLYVGYTFFEVYSLVSYSRTLEK